MSAPAPGLIEPTTPDSADDPPSRTARLWARWPRWTAWGALLWSAAYAMCGVLWWSGADWYPFATVPLDRASSSLLESAPADVVGPAFLAVGALGVVAAGVLLRTHAAPTARRPAVSFGVLLAVTATCLIPDYTMLALLALWPVLAVFAVTGVEGSQHGIGDILYWHRVNLMLIFAGGLLWAGATLAGSRRSRGACEHCGRQPGMPSTPDAPRRERLLRLGHRFVVLAVVATIPYDITRFAWYFGRPLGLSDALYKSLQDPPELLAVGLGLGVLSTIGAALTHGLVARWGERFPSWMPFVAGRRVPVMLAVAPATMVTVTLPPAAVMFASPALNGGFDLANWGAWLPSMFWIFWAVGLGGATWAYHQRRRGPCRHCCPGTQRSTAGQMGAASKTSVP